jgi:hypothetical protein
MVIAMIALTRLPRRGGWEGIENKKENKEEEKTERERGVCIVSRKLRRGTFDIDAWGIRCITVTGEDSSTYNVSCE